MSNTSLQIDVEVAERQDAAAGERDPDVRPLLGDRGRLELRGVGAEVARLLHDLDVRGPRRSASYSLGGLVEERVLGDGAVVVRLAQSRLLSQITSLVSPPSPPGAQAASAVMSAAESSIAGRRWLR